MASSGCWGCAETKKLGTPPGTPDGLALCQAAIKAGGSHLHVIHVREGDQVNQEGQGREGVREGRILDIA